MGRAVVTTLILTLLIVAALYGVYRFGVWSGEVQTEYEAGLAAGQNDQARFYASSPEEQRRMISRPRVGYLEGLMIKWVHAPIYKDKVGNVWIILNDSGRLDGPYAKKGEIDGQQ